MPDKSYIRYRQLQAELETDEEYLYLHRCRLTIEPGFLELLRKLPANRAELIREYLGICGEIGQRETELACFLP